MRRLFSPFAHSWPGAGLLLMRAVGGVALVDGGVAGLRGLPGIGVDLLHLLAIGAGVLLLVGLWTPLAGILGTVFAVCETFSKPPDPWVYVLLGTLSTALAMLGPGAWSADARLFGWKRIRIDTRKS